MITNYDNPDNEGQLPESLQPPTEGLIASLEVNDDDAEVDSVKHQRSELRHFIKDLSPDDVKSGNWFTKLVAEALSSYAEKVDWRYFQEKYKGVPVDGIAQQRIKMASRYAALGGGASAAAYSAAIVVTIGSAGGSSALSLPAAAATLMLDLAYITQLQLRLAHDLSVLYRVPLDLSDPDDMWKLIRVAFAIKGGELAREGLAKSIPLLIRPLVKRFYSKGVLTAAKGLPVVGKFLLQRNVIKVGIPVVGVPLSAVLNYYTTRVVGRHAQTVFRSEARVIELAYRLSGRSQHPQLMLWVAWLVILADHKISDDETLLMKHLVQLVHAQHQVVDEQLANVIELDADDVWKRLDAESGDLTEILDVATRVATVDGAVTAAEQNVIVELENRCRRSGTWL